MIHQIIFFILGVIGLNVLVFCHELGHYFMARWLNIKVKVFSMGIGPKWLSWQRASTRYQLAYIPLGGYCVIDDNYMSALYYVRFRSRSFPYYHVRLKRLFIILGGPLFSLIAAFLMFFLASLLPNIEDGTPPKVWVTDKRNLSKLETGDKIIAINNYAISSYEQIDRMIRFSSGNKLTFTVERKKAIFNIDIVPYYNEIGLGYLPLHSFAKPYVASIEAHSDADRAMMQAGDLILAVNHMDVTTIGQFLEKIVPYVYRDQAFMVTVQRDSHILYLPMSTHTNASSHQLMMGISFVQQNYAINNGLSLPGAWQRGSNRFFYWLQTYVYTLKNFVTKISIYHIISGPIQHAYTTGNTASVNSYITKSKWLSTLVSLNMLLRFLGITSIALAVVNLLPIPLLDGGHVLLTIFEILWPTQHGYALFIKVYQYLGLIILTLMLILSLMSDTVFLSR
jgi:regulator of sigma E protease